MGFKNKKFYNLIKDELVTTATQLGDTHCWYITYQFTTVERSIYWDTWRYTQSVTTKKHYRRFMNEIVGYGKEEHLASYYIDTCTSEYDPTKHKPYMYE